MSAINPLLEFLTKYQPSLYERLGWDDYFISLALLTSFRSPSPKLQVGAVITIDNRVIATGYNGYFPGAPHISINVDHRELNTVHAEQNAIADAAKRGASINQATIYVSHYPCLNCAKMIIASGVRTVKYLHDYKNDPITKDLFDQGQVTVTKYQCPSVTPDKNNYVCEANQNLQRISLTQAQIDRLKDDYRHHPEYYQSPSQDPLADRLRIIGLTNPDSRIYVMAPDPTTFSGSRFYQRLEELGIVRPTIQSSSLSPSPPPVSSLWDSPIPPFSDSVMSFLTA